jgi:hypothetical protein
VARVKKIIAADDDISNCSNNAAFVITVAAEMFLQHLVDQSYNIVKSERKPRRNIQYRDVANAVSRVENLEFLADVVPKTMTYKAHKHKQRQQEGAQEEGSNLAPHTDSHAHSEAQMPAPESRQGMIGADGRVVMPQQVARPPPPPEKIKIGLDGNVERQAINGASSYADANPGSSVVDVAMGDAGDAGDAETEDGSMHTANDEVPDSPGRKMEL